MHHAKNMSTEAESNFRNERQTRVFKRLPDEPSVHGTSMCLPLLRDLPANIRAVKIVSMMVVLAEQRPSRLTAYKEAKTRSVSLKVEERCSNFDKN
jgi:hypothetical protein